MKKMLQLYSKLCVEYNDNNIQRICSFQSFLQSKFNNCKSPAKKALIGDVIKYAETDFVLLTGLH